MGLSFLESVPSSDEILRNYDAIVDALFGFSFQGPPSGEFATIIGNIVDSGVPVLSVDVPSGALPSHFHRSALSLSVLKA